MGAVAEHGVPDDLEGRVLISIGVACNEFFAVEVFGAAHCVGVAHDVLHFQADELHGRGGHVVAAAEGHGEGFGAGLEVHGLRTGEVEGIAHLHEAGGEHVVAECVDVAFLHEGSSAHSVLLGGVDQGAAVDGLVCLYGDADHVHRHGAGHVVHGDGGKLAFGHNDRDVFLLELAFHGEGLAVGVGLAAHGDAHAVGEDEGVDHVLNDHLGEGPLAACVRRAALFPEAERGGAVERVLAYAAEPVEVLSGHVRRVVGRDVVEVFGEIVELEERPFRAFVREGHEVFAVAVATLLFEADPFLGLVAVDVIRVFVAFHGIEGEEAVVVGRLRGCSLRVGIVAGTRNHGVEVLGPTLIWGG